MLDRKSSALSFKSLILSSFHPRLCVSSLSEFIKLACTALISSVVPTVTRAGVTVISISKPFSLYFPVFITALTISGFWNIFSLSVMPSVATKSAWRLFACVHISDSTISIILDTFLVRSASRTQCWANNSSLSWKADVKTLQVAASSASPNTLEKSGISHFHRLTAPCAPSCDCMISQKTSCIVFFDEGSRVSYAAS